MNISLRKIASTLGSILIVIGVVVAKGCNRTKLDNENTQYYQLDELNHANDCSTIHNELVDFIVDAQPTIEKGKSVRLPAQFSTRACGQTVDVHGQIPALHNASVAYLNEYKATTSSIDANGDHMMSPSEFKTLVEKHDALYQKGVALHNIYNVEEEKWYRARLETVGSDHSRRYIHWIYTLALDINATTRNLESDNVDIATAEKTIANLKQNIAEMKEDMIDSNWDTKADLSAWLETMPAYLEAAEVRLNFVKTKAASASDEQKEASIDEFEEAAISDQPDNFSDMFIVPGNSSSPSRHHF